MSDAGLEAARKRSRRKEADRADHFVSGWAFHVPLPAFLAALDIRRDERVLNTKDGTGNSVKSKRFVWSQGDPPRFAFSQGDTFHTPSRPHEDWAKQLEWMTHRVTVLRTEGDRVDVEIIAFPTWHRKTCNLTQGELAALLRGGGIDKAI